MRYSWQCHSVWFYSKLDKLTINSSKKSTSGDILFVVDLIRTYSKLNEFSAAMLKLSIHNDGKGKIDWLTFQLLERFAKRSAMKPALAGIHLSVTF